MKALKIAGFALVLGGGFVAAAAFPLLPRAARDAITQAWARLVLAVLGVRLEVEGEPSAAPALVVCNHVSWLDVLAITALRPAAFVCKAEIAGWPGLGWLLTRAGTIFMRRGSAPAAAQAAEVAAERLRAGCSVAVFPEGTSTSGGELLPFHAAFFQSAVDARRAVQPLAVQYTSDAAVYAHGISFGESLGAIAAARGLRARLCVLPAFAAENRRDAALRAHDLIGARLRTGSTDNSGSEPEFGLAQVGL